MITGKYVRTGLTKKYSRFISPAHQRDISNRSVKGIMNSMIEHGMISAVSVRKSSKYRGKLEVFSGQHTVEACKRLSLPVVYCEFKGVNNRVMISLDASSKSWSMKDTLKFGVTDGITDYIFLDRIYRQERLPLTALIMMYGGAYGNVSFKSLKWKALFIDRGDTILKYIKEIESTFNIKHVRFARFIWGFGKVLDSGKYDQDRMIYQLGKCSSMLTKQANPEGYISNIEMVYNFRVSQKNKVQFTQK